MNYTRLICSITLLAVVFGSLCFGSTEKDAAAEVAGSVGAIEYSRLYAFLSKRNQRYYRTNAQIPDVSDGPWKNDGPICIVAKNAAPGLMPVYQFVKLDSFGARFFYALLPKEVNLYTVGVDASGKWQNQGVAFYVSPTKQPDMVRLYRLIVRAKIEWSGHLDSVATVKAPEEIFLTTDTAAKDKAVNAGWTSSSLGYVWTKAPKTPLPDLTIENTFVKGSSVVAQIRNKGQVGSPDLSVRIRILDQNGKQVSYLDKKMGATFQNMPATITFDLGNQNLTRKSYQVVIDPAKLVKESDETNNETQVLEFPAPKVKLNIDPEQANKLRAPTFAITAAQPSGQNTLYLLSVTNWESFKPEWFQSLQNVLPPNPCGPGNYTNARLQARISVIKTGMPLNAGCKPLNSQQDLKSLQFESAFPLKDSDRVQITLVDRLNNSKYESEPYAVGWLGLGKILSPQGCKYFLGRAGSFLCTSKQGFDACENLRKQGKPIKCTQAGNK